MRKAKKIVAIALVVVFMSGTSVNHEVLKESIEEKMEILQAKQKSIFRTN